MLFTLQKQTKIMIKDKNLINMIKYFQNRNMQHIFNKQSLLYYYNVLTTFSERYKLKTQHFKLINRSFRTIYYNYLLHEHSYKNGKYCPY